MNTFADTLTPGSQPRSRAKAGRNKAVPAYKQRLAQRIGAGKGHQHEDADDDEVIDVNVSLEPIESDTAAQQAVQEEGSAQARESRTSVVAVRQHVRAFLERHMQDGLRQAQLRKSAIPYIVACAPVAATSVLAPLWLSWAMSWITLISLYRVTQTLDATAFEVSPKRGFFAYALPVNAFMAMWCALLAAAGQQAIIATSVFPHIALLCLAIAPTCRWARDRQTRRVPLLVSYCLGALCAVAAQGLMVFKDFGLA